MKKKNIILAVVCLVVVLVLILMLVIVSNRTNKSTDLTGEGGNITQNSEVPVEIEVDSEVSQEMYRMLNCDGINDFFYNFNCGKIGVDDLTDEVIQTVAYTKLKNEDDFYKEKCKNTLEPKYANLGTTKFEASVLKDTVKEIFGEIKYTSSNVYDRSVDMVCLNYNKENDSYYIPSIIYEGTSNVLIPYTVKVLEYSDRYEVIQKSVYFLNEDGETLKTYSWYPIDNKYYLGEGKISAEKIKNKLYSVEKYSDYMDAAADYYYDKLTTYKHVFTKTEDGFVWTSSEIIK